MNFPITIYLYYPNNRFLTIKIVYFVKFTKIDAILIIKVSKGVFFFLKFQSKNKILFSQLKNSISFYYISEISILLNWFRYDEQDIIMTQHDKLVVHSPDVCKKRK